MSKVEWKRLGDVCCFKKGQMITLKTAIKGSVPVISSGQQPSFYHNCANRNGETIVVAGSGAYAGFVSYWDTPIFVADAFSVSPKNLQTIIVKYLFYYLQNNQETICHTKTTGGIPHVYSRFIENYIIPIPPKHIQQQIVNQLDTFTTLIAKLESELALRQKQYEFYREELLNFDGDEEVEWKKLGEICDIGTGNNNREDAITDGLYPFFVRSKEVFRINKYLFDEEAVIIPGEGGIGDIFHYVSGKYGLHQRAYRIHPKACIYNCKYIYYYLAANFKQYIVQKSVSATVTSIRKPMLEDFCICIPSPELQQYIVDKLDTFEQLIAALKREIALRRKQYEFYREKLLTFE